MSDARISDLVGKLWSGELSRRDFIKRATAAGMGASVISAALSQGTMVAPGAKPGGSWSRYQADATTLIIADSLIGNQWLTLDPAWFFEINSTAAMNLVNEPLYHIPDGNKPTEIVPLLATDLPSFSEDGLVATIKLRQGVKFHDGSSFDASSVKFVFDRILGPEQTLRKGTWAQVLEKVDVVDQYTVKFTTKVVDPFFHTRLTGNGTGAIFSADAFKKNGIPGMAKNPVGTGPFKFTEWVKDDHVTVERFDGYWGGAPYLDKVIVKPLPEAETRVIGLESGDIQLAIRLNPEHIDRIEKNNKLKLLRNDTQRHYYMGMALLKKPYSDIRVRQALNYAIDKESLLKNTLSGLGKLQGGLLPVGAPGYVDLSGFKYDPAKAKQLLADAGYPNGFTATFTGTKGIYLKDYEIEQALQVMWKAVGVNINLNIVENAKYLELLREDPKKSSLEMWWDTMGGAGQNPAEYFLTRFGCDFFRPVGTNTAGACFPGIDSLAQTARVELDAAKRNATLKTVQEQMSEQAPAVWLFSITQLTGTSAKLHDPVIRNESLFADAKTWLEE